MIWFSHILKILAYCSKWVSRCEQTLVSGYDLFNGIISCQMTSRLALNRHNECYLAHCRKQVDTPASCIPDSSDTLQDRQVFMYLYYRRWTEHVCIFLWDILMDMFRYPISYSRNEVIFILFLSANCTQALILLFPCALC